MRAPAFLPLLLVLGCATPPPASTPAGGTTPSAAELHVYSAGLPKPLRFVRK